MNTLHVRGGFAKSICAIALIACNGEKVAQHVDIPPPIPIAQWAERVDTLAGTYTYASPPVQFGDTLVVLADGRDRIVWKIDIVNGKRIQLGSKGDGPGEYRYAGLPVRARADSVALLFGWTERPLPLISVANGRGRSHAIPQPAGAESNPLRLINSPMARYADDFGNVYGAPTTIVEVNAQTGRPNTRSMRAPDTVPIVRQNLYDGRVDTILRLPVGVIHGRTQYDADGRRTSSMSLGSYGAVNGWIITNDGRLITADASTYTLQVHDTAGAIVNTWHIPSNVVTVSEKGWNEHVQKSTKGAIVEIKKLTDKTFAEAGVAPPKIPEQQYVVPKMPRELPRLNFGEGAYQMRQYENALWVPVNITDPPNISNWDVIDLTTGKRTMTISLPSNQHLQRVTNLGAYVSAIDDDDLVRIILYRHKQ